MFYVKMPILNILNIREYQSDISAIRVSMLVKWFSIIISNHSVSAN